MVNEEKLNQINTVANQRCTAALSKLIDKEIEVVFFKPIITEVKEVSPIIGSQEMGTGIYLPITGAITGSGLFLFPKEASFNLCDMAMKKEFRTSQELSSFDEGILKEIGNILLGNYLAVFSNTLKAEITEGMPKFSSGMFGAILEEVITSFAKDANKVLVIRIDLTVKDTSMKGYMILMFKPEKIEALLNAL